MDLTLRCVAFVCAVVYIVVNIWVLFFAIHCIVTSLQVTAMGRIQWV
jgi:hypothetical protein